MDIPVIAIDGPSATGKGTLAASLAAHMGFHLLDSGSLYRILGVAVARAGLSLDETETIAQFARNLDIEFGLYGPGSVALDGEDISLIIRTDLGSDMASKVGAIPAAREALLDRQLAFRKSPGLVADGRDMGTVVFPDAIVKFFLTASTEARAERRYKQLLDKGIDAIFPSLLRELDLRDARDRSRSVSPMQPAEDAIVVDTTELNRSEVMAKVLECALAALEPNR
ncbi:MAG: cytidylate kinase [Gammaproteobacteria bacterium]|nr:cytidylate kinase [Gammaproteobacteria bacterium]HBW82728.1 (d)CMP kinase [Gammaproteobacteria bacterium]|tara:strand:+ start:6328 stop:7005 length:678 start_codon:yes stop_codon:yes gene_type:complete